MLIVLIVLGVIVGFILGVLIFGKEPSGTMYFWTDPEDDHVYLQAVFDDSDVHKIEKKKTVTLKCIKIPPINSSQENQGI